MVHEPPRFLFDVMLARLCRYVRAAGYDASLAQEGETDAALLARAGEQGRWFVTLDRRIVQHKAAAGRAILLEHGSVAQQALALARAVRIDWLYRPFTRCLVDNTVLTPAPPDARATLPPRVRETAQALLQCPCCRRLYWAGSHWRRMQAVLERWAELGCRAGVESNHEVTAGSHA